TYLGPHSSRRTDSHGDITITLHDALPIWWPKNQNRCCHRIGPPLPGLNTCEPSTRSAPRTSRAAASGWKAMSTRMPVMRTFQEKIGIRNIVMPGARIVMTVVMKLTEPRMVPKPCRARPRTHRLPPAPGVKVVLLNGAYAVQPNEAAPCGVRKPDR